ncbi:hypothetical protein ONE56_16710 [Vibrio mytili]|uniref:hypothetical protein n=1 Tax=Vibrio mytili TaxID=50718 RepID=UPI003C6F93F3
MRLSSFLQKHTKYQYIHASIGFMKCVPFFFCVYVIYAAISHLWDKFEISYEDYDQYSAYLDHEFCGNMAIDYASDGRVDFIEKIKVEDCIRQGQKRDFYSKLESK